MGLILRLGSIAFTVWVSGVLMVILTIATVLESARGTPFVQNAVYQTRWFDIYLSLICVNLLCSIWSRFPLNKHHFGFVVTHLGIVGILAGALLTRMFGLEGQVTLLEGEFTNAMLRSGYQLKITAPGGPSRSVDIPRPGKFDLLTGTASPRIKAIVSDNMVHDQAVVAGPQDAPVNRALRVHVRSGQVKTSRTFWLVEKDPAEEHPGVRVMGPVTFVAQIGSPKSVQAPRLRLMGPLGEKLAAVDLSGPLQEEYLLSGGIKLKGLRYYPKARVVNNKIVDADDGGPMNPAVEFDLVDGDGRNEHYLKFAFYPDFESMHARTASNIFDVLAIFEIPAQWREQTDSSAVSVTCFLSEGGTWRYRISSPPGTLRDGEIVLNQWTDAGWLDWQFRVEEILERAQVSSRMIRAQDGQSGVMAVELIAVDGPKQYSQWMTPGQTIGFQSAAGIYQLELAARSVPLPFTLGLKDFRIEEYPGTESPASFESDVVLKDARGRREIHAMISMNRPLDYKGFRIFQSSYAQDPEYGESSTFTVSRNPGIGMIYLSSFLILLGAICQFYVRPLSRQENASTGKEPACG